MEAIMKPFIPAAHPIQKVKISPTPPLTQFNHLSLYTFTVQSFESENHNNYKSIVYILASFGYLA